MGGLLLGRLLRRALAEPDLLSGDRRHADETTLVRWSLDVDNLVAHLIAGAGERLLELGLVVDVTGASELDPRVEGRHDGGLDPREAVLQVDGGDGRLEQRRQNVAATRDPVELRRRNILCLLEQELRQVELLRDAGTAMPRDDVRSDLREASFRRVGEPVVQRPRNRELEDGVAEELEALIGGGPIRRP